ncbi:UDP-GlcNAc:betaGal beta-1,3-N-acetylglucosaminyltransferase-like protein 1 [Ixodes scapularis]
MPSEPAAVAAVSIITPLYNGERWIDQCFDSVLAQNFGETLELSVYDDSSTDGSLQLLQSWKPKLEARGIRVCISSGASSDPPKGVGFAKNRAVRQSCGKYLCFLDIDDIMHPDRIQKQYEAATRSPPNAIVGSRFHRLPEGSTERYSSWANLLGHEKLEVQVFTSHGPTVIMPTWFCSRQVFEAVGGFDERGKGIPEDLIFFYRHLDLGGRVVRVDCDLLTYRYHPQQTTFSISESTIWDVRMERLCRTVLVHWTSFTIWNAGKQGRRFYRSLDPENRRKVLAFCDVDEKKIAKGVYIYEESKAIPRPRVPIVHFTAASTPLVVCMKMDLTDGSFEANLASLNLKEGVDYIHFA